MILNTTITLPITSHPPNRYCIISLVDTVKFTFILEPHITELHARIAANYNAVFISSNVSSSVRLGLYLNGLCIYDVLAEKGHIISECRNLMSH